MSNRFVIILLAIIVIFAGVFVFNKNKDSKGSSGNSSAQPSNHVIGQGKKGVTLIEYGDYQCPACGQYYPIVKQVQEKYNQDIYFQFRNFPLTQIHPNAMVGARAAEATAKQNKFWEMHDTLYEQQQTWSTASNPSTYFEQYAQQLGLNVAQFKQDMASSAVNDTISADIAAAQKAGANGTPTFVLDGKKIDNPQTLDAFNKVIDDAIKAKNQ